MFASELFGDKWSSDFEDFDIKGIAYDSRKVQEGYVFACIKGFETDGHKYVSNAVQNGACVIIAEDKLEDISVPVLYYDNTRTAIAEIACRFYDYPSEKFELIGVTGTNGKTTTTHLLKSIMEAAGKCVGLIGTNHNIVGDKVLVTQTNTPTTPDSLELQQMFDEMARAGADCVIMEVSSHALDLHRVHGCKFKAGAFTNLTRDHLDFHKTMENYMNAKAKLFDISEHGSINIDDEYGKRIFDLHENDDILTYGIENDADVTAENIVINARGTAFDLIYKGQKYKTQIAIPGKFSVYNALTAATAALGMGIDIDVVIDGLENAEGVLGRVEVVPTDTDFTVIIDYAHTPDGLENIIKAVKEFAVGRVITLFGCGGDRDNSKRAIMGEIAGNLSDFTVITSDNPRTEDPEKIISQIMEGMKRTEGKYEVVVNRREAIEWVLNFAKKDDIIILAGKGQETYQIIGKEKFDFDERVVVYNALNNK